MKKNEIGCTNCWEYFSFKPIVEDNHNFCSHKCLKAWRKREITKLDPIDWKKFVKMINDKR